MPSKPVRRDRTLEQRCKDGFERFHGAGGRRVSGIARTSAGIEKTAGATVGREGREQVVEESLSV